MAVAVLPVRCHVSADPSDSTWNASSMPSAAKEVGCPRFAGGGEKAFWSPVASTVVPFGLRYPKCARKPFAVFSTHSTTGVSGFGVGGAGGSQPFCQIAWPSSDQLYPGKVCVWPSLSTYV